jgi:hypothetical protein
MGREKLQPIVLGIMAGRKSRQGGVDGAGFRIFDNPAAFFYF